LFFYICQHKRKLTPMSKQKQPIKKNTPKTTVKNQPPSKTAAHKLSSRNILIALIAVLALTLASYYPSLNNDFTNWDDPAYVTENQMLRTDKPIDYFTKDKFVQGHFIPLSMISFSMDYKASKLDPKRYHLVNLILHLLNTGLVFFFVFLLIGNWQGAFIASALFGIHPMHVESVAWVTERKDVLYAFFYLASVIIYTLFIRYKKPILYVGALVLFILSLLSKEQAFTLPFTMLLIDYFCNRKFTLKVIMEKIPFFILSLVIGFVSIKAAHSSTGTSMAFTFNSFLYAFYGLATYLFKFLVPVQLACYYPYPTLIGGVLPVIFYIAPFVVIGLTALVYFKFRKNKSVIFGLLFFLLNIGPLLQLLPVGPNIMAERYSYIPYIGLSFIIAQVVMVFFGYNIKEGFQPGKQIVVLTPYKNAALTIAALFITVLAYASNERCKVWKNTETLWKSEIEEEPDVPTAYNNLGFEYKTQGRYAEALPLLSKAIMMQPSYEEPYITRAEIERIDGKNALALNDLNKAISLKPENAGAYQERAILYCIEGKLDSGGADFNKSIQLDPTVAEAFCSRGNYDDMTGNYNAAMADYSKALELKPDLQDAYLNRGAVRLRHNKPDSAIIDLTTYLQLVPQSGDGYAKRSNAWFLKKDYGKALEDAQQAQKLRYSMDPNYIQSLENHK